MKKNAVFIISIVTFLVLGFRIFNLSDGRKGLSKDAVELEYRDITEGNPSLGSLATGIVADVALVETGNGRTFIVCFKKWKPYKDISVYLEGDKLKIFYNEDKSKSRSNMWINGVVYKGIDVKNIIIYKNNKRVLFGIGRSFGIE